MQISNGGKIIFLSIILSINIGATAIAQKIKPKSKSSYSVLPLDPAVRTGKLLNGFTYYIRHNEEPKRRVLMYMINNVGSVLENEDQRGLAHFTAHMSFNGTAHFPHNELVNYLQKSGIRFGADLNAYTSFNETVYELPIPSNKPEILKTGIDIMHEWAQSATLDSEEIDKERGVVLEEKRLGKGADERMRRITWPVLLNNSRYANRLPIGLDTVLNNFKKPVILSFYKDWYRPDLQALVIVGDINADSLEKVVRLKLSDLKNPLHERLRTKYTVPLTGKNQFIIVTDKEMDGTVAEVLIKHKMLPIKTAGDYRKAIIQGLFNQLIADRYAELARLDNPPFISADAGISAFLGGMDIYGITVETRPGELEKGFKAVWRETERVKRFGFSATELSRAKKSYLAGMQEQLQEKDKTNSANYVKEYQEYFLNGTTAPGIAIEAKLTYSYMPDISLKDIRNVIKEYVVNNNRDILIEAPLANKAILPQETTINNWIKSVATENLSPYKDQVSILPFLSANPVAGKIISEQRNKELNITTLILSNGVKVILKPTDFKNDQVIFSSFAPGGTSLYNDAEYQNASNAAGLIASSGAGSYNATELDKYLAGKEVKVGPYISERYEGFSGSSTPKDLETALEMVYAYFTKPRKDSTIFKIIVDGSKSSLINRSNDPKSVFSDTVSATLSNYNSRRTGPSLEKLNQLNLDTAFRIYKERFADASHFTFTFVGNIDTNTVKPLLEKYLGSLPSTNKKEQAIDLNIHIPSGKIEKNVYKGSESQSTVMLVYSGDFDYSAENKVKMDALKETLQIRLLERLREDEGGVYSPGVFDQINKFPNARYAFIIQFGCAPKNVDKLIASTLDEIDKLRIAGPPQENVDKWWAEAKTNFEPQLKTNGFWLSYLNGQMQNDEPLNQFNKYFTELEKVSTIDLKDTAVKYLNGKNYIRLVLLPENQAK